VHDDNKSNSGQIGQIVVLGGSEKTQAFFLWMFFKNYLTYSQLLQNLLMDYCHFGYITKLTKKICHKMICSCFNYKNLEVKMSKKKLVCSYSWLDLWNKLLKVYLQNMSK
jgi:hypothetical protein